MPDVFGNETPQEVLARIRQTSRENFLAAQSTGNRGLQAGASLAAIFGGPLAKTLDTRAARKQEAQRLIKTQGIDREQAEEQAKQSVGREFAGVRQAQKIQDANSAMSKFMDGLDPSIPGDMRQAAGMHFMANRLRSMGLVTQANNLSAQATAAQTAAEDRALKLRKLEADIGKVEKETDFIGTTGFQKDVLRKEQIIGELADPNSQITQSERESLMREKGHLEAKILKDETITGRTEGDLKADPVLRRSLFNTLSDNESLLTNLSDTLGTLDDLSQFEKTFWAGLTVDALGFMEEFFGRNIDESEQEFVNRVTDKEGKATLVAAKIRHALTGAQMSAFEIVFLEPFLPGPDDSVAEIKAKIGVIRDYTKIDSETRMELFNSGLTERYFESKGVTPVSVDTDRVTETTDPITPTRADAEASAASNLDAMLEERLRKAREGN